MDYVFLILFIIISLIHLYASLKFNKKLRAVTKVFILPLLIGFYCVSVQTPSVLLLVALITSWLGDVLLIPHGTKFFVIGGCSFIVSHIFFIITYICNINFSNVAWWIIIIVALAYIAAVMLVMRGLKADIEKKLFIALSAYLLMNGAMNCFAWFQMAAFPCLATILMLVGAISFFTSDSSLFYVRCKKSDKEKSHFVVMLTYIIAEFLITYGMILIN